MSKRKQMKHAEVSPPVAAPSMAVRWLLLLFALALVPRLFRLGYADLWQDEILFVMTANPAMTPMQVFHEYWSRILVSMAWLPLPAMLQNIYYHFLTGDPGEIVHSTFHARFPGALMGAAGCVGLFLAARRLLSTEEAWGASLILALTLYPVFFAREAHAYPMLLGLAPFALYLFFTVTFASRTSWSHVSGLFGVLLLLNYTHLTAPFFTGVMVLLAAGWALWKHRATRSWREGLPALSAMLASGAACLFILPAFIKILTQENPHLATPDGHTPWFIWNDVISKLFLGEWPPLAAMAWLFFGAGVIGLWRRETNREACRVLVLLVMCSLAAITLAALRTQYLSPRYFAVVVPAMLLVTVAGFDFVAATPSRLIRPLAGRRAAVFRSLLGAFLLVHVALYLPPMFQLKNKSVDFGGIARWLNEHLAPGTPYVMESAYELRYVSGYYPTPNLLAAAPHVHGPGSEERRRLRERQRDFLTRFPEGVFVRSAWDGYNTPDGLWTWPDEHFRQQVDLRDDALRRLIAWGIYPNDFRSKLTPYSYVIRIHYNTAEDRLAIARDSDSPLIFHYANWQPQRIAQGLYVRVQRGGRSSFTIENVSGVDQVGRLVIDGGVESPAEEVEMFAQMGQQILPHRPIQGNALVRMDFGEVTVPPGRHEVQWGATDRHRRFVSTLLIYHAELIRQ